ncbi:MAG: hypothetical protein HFJ84_10900 [Clostridiales bacterium]|jgi:hypothetical protein|nr:hypothetical protein [Clostridiales bacterium]
MEQPILKSTPAFDASLERLFSFTYIGNQVFSHRFRVYNNATNAVVYDKKVESFQMEHTIPAATLKNGILYRAQVSVFDKNGVESNLSQPTLFYCYAIPTLQITNLTANQIVRSYGRNSMGIFMLEMSLILFLKYVESVLNEEKSTYLWTILVDIPIRKVEDLDFERFDRYAQARSTYVYTLTPLPGNTEGNMNINSVKSDFDGMFIMEANQGFETDLEISVETQRNHPSSVANPLGGKYPFVIYNSEQNYDSGSATELFALRNVESCNWDFDQSFTYRNQLNDFLANNQPKFLKLYDGRGLDCIRCRWNHRIGK